MDFGTALGASDATAATITLWVDPTPSSSDPAASTGTLLFEVGQTNTPANRTQWVQSAFHFGWVELQSVTLGSEFDEYRIGTSFADITGMGAVCRPTAEPRAAIRALAAATRRPAATAGRPAAWRPAAAAASPILHPRTST